MFKDTIIELDRATKALRLHDVDTAALCLRKALVGHTEMMPPEPTPHPHRDDPRAEFFKAVTALEIKEYDLAGVCLQKALDQVKDLMPVSTYRAMTRFSDATRQENLSSMATYLREAIKTVVGDHVIEPVSVSPS